MMDVRALLTALVLLLHATSGAAATQQRFPPAQPESVGLSSRSLQNLVAHVQSWLDDADLVGAEILVIKDRKTVLHEVLGLKDMDGPLELERNTICCIRSMSKPFTGTAIQMLIDEGKLMVSDRASKYLASFDNDRSREITIDQLLTHTSGLPLTAMTKAHTRYSGQREVADEVGRIGPATPPGSQFQYSDAGTEALAAIVGEVSGMAPDEFIQKRILEPLELNDTYCVLGEGGPDRNRVSSNHAGIPGAWHEYWDAHDPPLFPYLLAAAGMYSTAMDYARFLTLWMDEGKLDGRSLLSSEAVRRALTPQNVMLQLTSRAPMPTEFAGRRTDYAQLWMTYPLTGPDQGPMIFGHGGSDGTAAFAVPEQDLIALYFTQSRNGLTTIRFHALLDKLIKGEPIEPPPPRRIDEEELAQLIGTYGYSEKNIYPELFLLGPRLALGLKGDGIMVLSWPDESGTWRFFGSRSTVRFGDDSSLILDQRGKRMEWSRVEPGEDLPSVAELMELRRERLGGARIAQLKSIRMEGEIEVAGARGPLRLLAEESGRHKLEWRAGESFERLAFDGERAWLESTTEALHERRGVFLQETKHSHPFLTIQDWRPLFESVDVVRSAELDGKPVYALRVATRGLPPSIKYVCASSGELQREECYVMVKGVRPLYAEISYGDYREVEGVRLPFQRTIDLSVGAGFRMVEHYRTCVPNVAVSAREFRLEKE